MSRYEFMSLHELIEEYAFVSIHWERKEDIDKCHARIKQEITRRYNFVMKMLDDEQTLTNPIGLYNRMIEG